MPGVPRSGSFVFLIGHLAARVERLEPDLGWGRLA